MAAWITSHYRHPANDDLPWHIYRKSNSGKRDRQLAEGDVVLFYENGNPAKTDVAIRRLGDVATPNVPLRVGARGIVYGGYISGKTRERIPSDLVYNYGDLSEWRYVTPCKLKMQGLISLTDIWSVIGRRVPAKLFGLYPLTPEQYSQLEGMLRMISG